MHHSHALFTEHHQDFLKTKIELDLTGEKIEEGHTVVICAACEICFL
jgi:hypothetical protein